MTKTLEFTGERFTPECVREIWYEHYHRYVFAHHLITGKRVLDGACGEGYGSHLLAANAGAVVGVDISATAIEHAQQRYQRDNLHFLQADCCALPFPDASFDCVVSFETLEHLAAQDELLQEFRRVLNPNGFLLISSPDKANYSDATGYQNEFHVKELYRQELLDLLGRYFPATRLFGQKLLFQSAIWDLQQAERLVVDTADAKLENLSSGLNYPPMYYLALCALNPAALPQPTFDVSWFGDQEESVYQHYYSEIRKLSWALGRLEDYEARIQALEAQLAAQRGSD